MVMKVIQVLMVTQHTSHIQLVQMVSRTLVLQISMALRILEHIAIRILQIARNIQIIPGLDGRAIKVLMETYLHISMKMVWYLKAEAETILQNLICLLQVCFR